MSYHYFIYPYHMPFFNEPLSVKKAFINSNTAIFIYLTFIYLILNYLINEQTLTQDILFQSLKDKLDSQRIKEVFNTQKRFEVIAYFVFPLVLLIKISLVVACISIVKYIYSINISSASIFRIVIISEIVFIIAALIKYTYLLIFPPQTIEDASSFSVSLIQLVKEKSPSYLSYFLSTINLFEVVYFLLLAKGIQEYTQFSFKKSLSIIGMSYGIGLFLWVAVVTFLLIQIS